MHEQLTYDYGFELTSRVEIKSDPRNVSAFSGCRLIFACGTHSATTL